MPITDPITVIDVLDVSVQGSTAPHLCEASDKRRYYVKGRGAGIRSLLCEWAAGHLGRALGLPIPEFKILEVPRDLARSYQGALDLRSLGSGPVFGSLKVENSEDFRLDHRDDVPESLEFNVLMFDFWVRNADRALTPLGGNPNLLWDLSNGSLSVIDHNMAFDVNFDAELFWGSHVFADRRREIWEDPLKRDHWTRTLNGLLPHYTLSLLNAPPEWLEENEEISGAGKFDKTENLSILEACLSSKFWSEA